MNPHGYGNCEKGDSDFGGLVSCYVNLPSNCSDMEESNTNPGKWLSAQACGNATGEEFSEKKTQKPAVYILSAPPPTSTTPFDGCTVVESDEGGSKATGKKCIFPFTWAYNGVTYDGCAFVPGFDPFPWCSTKVDQDGVHVAGQGEWGKCDMTKCSCK